MRSVAYEAGRDRSTWLSRWLDRRAAWVVRLAAYVKVKAEATYSAPKRLARLRRWLWGLAVWLVPWLRRRALVVFGALLVAIGISFAAASGPERFFRVDSNLYVAVAGLFVAALAVERFTELVVAPWVGQGDRAIDRSILVGSLGLVVGVTLSGLIGLSALNVLIPDAAQTDGTFNRAVGVFLAGLAVAGGSKPLHDLVSRLEKNVQDKKKEVVAEESGETPSGTSGARRHRIGVNIENLRSNPTSVKTIREVRRLLPGWSVVDNGDGTVRATTFIDAEPGTPEHRQQAFAAANRVESQKTLQATAVAMPQVAPGDDPTDPRWALKALRLDADVYRHRAGVDDRGPVRVAVLDTGVGDHPDGVSSDRIIVREDIIGSNGSGGSTAGRIANWIFDGFDFDPMSSEGHGTSVASVIAAAGDVSLRNTNITEWWNTSKMIGVAPEAEIVSIRVMRGPVHIGDDDVAKGVTLALDHDADVVSMSLGGFGFKELRNAIDGAVDNGTIVVCAAGNAFNVVVEPAVYGTTVAVTSSTESGDPYDEGASRGPETDVAAPGYRVYRASFGGGVPTVEPSTGTTYATAHVAGVAALWLGKNGRERLRRHYPGRKLPQLFKHVLRETTEKWPPDLQRDWGTGRVDVKALLAFPVFTSDGAGEHPAIGDTELNAAFAEPDFVAPQDRVLGGIAAVFTGQGTLDVRADLVKGAAGIPGLIVAEVATNPPTDDQFRKGVAAGNGADLPVPAGATAELRTVLAAASDDQRRAAELKLNTTPLEPDWGVGLSKPLRRALEGRANTVIGYRWLGLVALVIASVLAARYAETGGDWLDSNKGIASVVAFLTIGIYAFAQAIERTLELTVARTVFRDVPGREADRALILLGVGILLGTIGSMLLDIGLLDSIGTLTNAGGNELEPDGVFKSTDALVTGLAAGGGAKPVHDLLTRIRIPLGQ